MTTRTYHTLPVYRGRRRIYEPRAPPTSGRGRKRIKDHFQQRFVYYRFYLRKRKRAARCAPAKLSRLHAVSFSLRWLGFRQTHSSSPGVPPRHTRRVR